jgi:hypothetical protein
LANIYEEDLIGLRENKDTAIKFIRPIIGAAEMLQNKKRYCLWLVNASAAEMKSSLFICERTDMVRKLRSESKRKATVTLAGTPYLFQEVREQTGDYLAVPIVSSASREYVPMKVFSKEVIPTNALLTIPKVELDTFAILQSKIFSLWLRTVGGKLKSDFRISAEIVYNNFPFPDLEKSDKNLLEKSGAELTKIRENFTDLSLADMYVPSLMPKELRDFHNRNDKLVLKVFGLDKEASDQEILSKLFERYLELIPANLFK